MRKFLSLSVSLIIINCIVIPLKAEEKSQTSQPVREFTVQETESSDLKAVPAVVESVHRAFARTRIGGTVDGLSITEGVHISAGDVIAIIVDPKQPLDIASLDAKLKSLEYELNLAATQKKRMEALKKENVTSQSALDKATTAVSVLENNIKGLQAEREKLMTTKGEGRVLAPLSGKVLKILVTNGSVVLPGDVIAEMGVEGMILRLSVPERHANFIEVGQEVKIQDPKTAHPDEIGEIQKIYPKLEQGRIIVDVSVPSLHKDAPIGQLYTVMIPTAKRKTIIIPLSFIKKRYGISYVTLKGGKEVVIQSGQQTDEDIEILSGLEANDVIEEPLS